MINKITSRSDIPVSLDASEDLDGGAIPNILPNTVEFASKNAELETILEFTQTNPQQYLMYNYDGSNPPTYKSDVNIQSNGLIFEDGSQAALQITQETSGNNLSKSGGVIRCPQLDFDYNITVTLDLYIDRTRS